MAFTSLLHHYLEYLRSPALLLVVFAIVGPILLEIFKNKRLATFSSSVRIPGCFRLGLSKGSNLDDQSVLKPTLQSETETPSIKALFTYPIKSCRGVELAASEVAATGLKYDRLFAFSQCIPHASDSSRSSVSDGPREVPSGLGHEWHVITQRELPRLALIETELWVPKPNTSRQSGRGITVDNGGCLILRFPFSPAFNPFGLFTESVSISFPLSPTEERMQQKQYELEPLRIWRDRPQAVNVTGEIHADDLIKLTAFLGLKHPVGMFRVDHSNSRKITRSLPKDKPDEHYTVGLADAFPFHILSLSSIRAQDDQLPAESKLKGKLDPRRFRANVYVGGSQAYDEDTWKRVLIGRCLQPQARAHANGASRDQKAAQRGKEKVVETDGEYHVACRTARCKLPNVDQDTGIKDANEPLATLSRTRKVDEGAYPHPCLGMQMIPLFQQGILRVGDEVRVIESGEHHYEKMYP